MMNEYAIVGVFLILGIAFGFAALIASWFLRPKPNNHNKLKNEVYECGMETIGETKVQFKINYFIVAIVFLIFDVETLFLYPWALVFKEIGTLAFLEMFIFLLILILGFIYAWKEGAFDWR